MIVVFLTVTHYPVETSCEPGICALYSRVRDDDDHYVEPDAELWQMKTYIRQPC